MIGSGRRSVDAFGEKSINRWAPFVRFKYLRHLFSNLQYPPEVDMIWS
jgi:hypothetical protein